MHATFKSSVIGFSGYYEGVYIFKLHVYMFFNKFV